ncbi:hypothetical protein CPB84DRAFT_1424044 [Gymnopilus junonius]|uniref:Uncharacterized protein n=1 Tax=Gymnopilus junonius TaxID=109634 RepID=A0A9P5NKU2_GYMJU|nr:hypothetical protein CPB84DRAFT_1424044 [Gymnopilus junonius]
MHCAGQLPPWAKRGPFAHHINAAPTFNRSTIPTANSPRSSSTSNPASAFKHIAYSISLMAFQYITVSFESASIVEPRPRHLIPINEFNNMCRTPSSSPGPSYDPHEAPAVLLNRPNPPTAPTPAFVPPTPRFYSHVQEFQRPPPTPVYIPPTPRPYSFEAPSPNFPPTCPTPAISIAASRSAYSRDRSSSQGATTPQRFHSLTPSSTAYYGDEESSNYSESEDEASPDPHSRRSSAASTPNPRPRSRASVSSRTSLRRSAVSDSGTPHPSPQSRTPVPAQSPLRRSVVSDSRTPRPSHDSRTPVSARSPLRRSVVSDFGMPEPFDPYKEPGSSWGLPYIRTLLPNL